MKTQRTMGTAALALLLGGMLGTGCVRHRVVRETVYVPQPTRTVVVTQTGPPMAPAETIPPPPSGKSYVWVPGYWNWEGNHWVWMNGRYVESPRPRAAWVPGHWIRSHGRWVWVEGHWRG